MGSSTFGMILFLFSSVLCDREHKVHNIVLYPERHSWCQTTPIKQIVATPGYEPVTIDNNVCVGACYSYSIPKTQPAEPGELIGPYCDSCQPLETKCYHVTLHADDQSTKTIQKRVEIITNCSCSTCSKIQTNDCEIPNRDTSELPFNLFSSPHHHKNDSDIRETPEISELLNMSPSKNRTDHVFSNGTNQPSYVINSKLIALLKSIQNQEEDEGGEASSNINYDKTQLKELLDIIEGSEHELSDKNLMDFVNFVNVHNSEDLELDLSKLKGVLENFLTEQKLSELGNLGKKDAIAINSDLKSYNVPTHFGIEGSHLNLGRHKGSHIGMGILKANPNIESNVVDSKNVNRYDGVQKKIEEINGKGHHHIGEAQYIGLEEGHLIKGPHGSLVIAPDDLKVEEKLNLESEEIRPNHEGSIVSYENHHHHHHHHRD